MKTLRTSSKNILIATGNPGKTLEIREMLKNSPFTILNLADMNQKTLVAEDQPDFYGNALKKAQEYARFYQISVIADDSGLVVPALKGEPGVYSARYAGENATDDENMNRLLSEMANLQDRQAYFECCMVYFEPSGNLIHAEGRCYGEILYEKKGTEGFGYDPVFYIPFLKKTLAELSLEEKNQISHRRHALSSLLEKMTGQGLL